MTPQPGARRFRNTRWTVVLRPAGADEDARTAFAELCEGYWTPGPCVRPAKRLPAEAAGDMTQAFFPNALEKGVFANARPERMYQLEPADDLTPERIYERRWMGRGVARLAPSMPLASNSGGPFEESHQTAGSRQS